MPAEHQPHRVNGTRIPTEYIRSHWFLQADFFSIHSEMMLWRSDSRGLAGEQARAPVQRSLPMRILLDLQRCEWYKLGEILAVRSCLGIHVEKKRSILVVDDDTDFVSCVRMVLEADGYDVACAFSTSECMVELEEKKPDLILLDVMMEKLVSGLMLAHELRADPDYRSIPILMMSAIRQETGFDVGVSKHSEYVAADEFLDKPVKPHVLLATVKRLLQLPEETDSGGPA
ncbi:MAG TPA: response regulator [Planctomycetota bacterium]|nr:response regulator [Planctomycetota bacterium]